MEGGMFTYEIDAAVVVVVVHTEIGLILLTHRSKVPPLLCRLKSSVGACL